MLFKTSEQKHDCIDAFWNVGNWAEVAKEDMRMLQ
jgi:hypothetical protein